MENKKQNQTQVEDKKKRKIILGTLLPITALAIATAIVVPCVICCNKNKTKVIKASLAEGTSADVLIKSSSLKYKTDSTVTLTIPDGKIIKPSELVVKVGDKTLTNDEYTLIGNIITIKAASMTGEDISLKVILNDINEFNKTDLSIIISAINTFEASKQDGTAMKALCSNFSDTPYVEEISSEITDPNRKIEAHLVNFIGKETTIKINGQNHVIRVIGINHDLLSDGSGKYAAFTFESFTLASDDKGVVMATRWNTTNNNSDFLNSQLRKCLTGEGSNNVEWYNIIYTSKGKEFQKINETRSLLEIIKATNKELALAIKPVQKQVAIRKTSNENEFEVTNYIDKLFTLTYNEVHYDTKNALDEGYMYQYYEGKQPAIRKKTDATVSHAGFSYWLPTPKAKTDGQGSEKTDAWYSDANDGKFWWYDADYTNAVSFAFCI